MLRLFRTKNSTHGTITAKMILSNLNENIKIEEWTNKTLFNPFHFSQFLGYTNDY